MAKSVLELAVGTGQWDAGLKKAKSALDNFTQSQGGLQQALSRGGEKMQKFVQMMGQTDSKAKTAKGQLNDYKSTIEQLTMQYNRMNDAQKKTIGQDYLQAIEQLKQKYRSVNEEIQAMNRSLNDVKAPNISERGGGALSGAFSDLTSQFTMGNLYAQAAMKGAEAVEAFGQKIVDVTKESMRLSVEAEGIQRAFDRLNAPGLLSGLREATHGTVSDLELMKSAVQFNNFKLPLEDLGTYLAFAQQKAKDTGQSVDYMVSSIVTGLGRQSVQILDNLGISAAEIRNRMKEGGDMTKVVAEIIREEMANAGDYVETASDRMNRAIAENQNAMKELGDQMRETFGDTTWEEFTTRLSTEWVKAEGDIVRGLDKISDYLPLLIALKEAFKDAGDEAENTFSGIVDWALICTGPLGAVVELIRQIGKETKSASDYILEGARSMMNAYWHAVNPINVFFHSDKPAPPIVTPTTPKVGKRGGGSGKSEPVYPEGSLAKLNQELQNLKKAQDLATDPESWNNYQVKIDEVNEKVKNLKSTYTEAAEAAKKLAEYQKAQETYENALASGNFSDILKAQEALNKLRGSVNLPDGNGVTVMGSQNTGISGAFEKSNMSLSSVNGFISAIKSELDKADLGSQVYDKLTEKLNDATIMSNVLKELITNGVNGIDLEEVGTLLKEKMLQGDIPDEEWKELEEQINAKLAELGIEPIKVNIDTKTVEKDAKDVEKSWQKAVGSVGQLAGALSQIEDPAAKIIGTIGQAIATVALTFASSLKGTMTPWDWIAAAAAGTATMISTIASIHSATGYAQGGIVKGNSYSGDNIGGLVDGSQLVGLNAGEVVLTHAQTASLAEELEGGNQGGTTSIPYVMGEQIYLGVNAFLKRSGRGELITTKG
jgi:tetratricopeptide (TPR) repeat protein